MSPAQRLAQAINARPAELLAVLCGFGLFFCLFSTFAVAKTQRDNRDGQVDTSQWVITVWVAFAAAILLTGWGLWRMQHRTRFFRRLTTHGNFSPCTFIDY